MQTKRTDLPWGDQKFSNWLDGYFTQQRQEKDAPTVTDNEVAHTGSLFTVSTLVAATLVIGTILLLLI